MESTKSRTGLVGEKRVTVVSVLAPNRIVVKEKLNKHLEAEYLKLQEELEASWSTRVKFTDENKPFPGTQVIVRHIRDPEWRGVYRGIIQEELPNRENTQYSVFMYDYGKIDILTTANIAVLPTEFKTKLKCRAFIINIAGIVPSRLYKDLQGMLEGNSAQPQYVEGGEWSPAALKYVKNWHKEYDVFATVFKAFDNAVKLGDIHRQGTGSHETESLAKALVKENFALFNKKKADDQVSYVPDCTVGSRDQTRSKENISHVKASSSKEWKQTNPSKQKESNQANQSTPNMSKLEEINPELKSELNKKSVLFTSFSTGDLEKSQVLSMEDSSAFVACNLSTESKVNNPDWPATTPSGLKSADESKESIQKQPRKVKRYTTFSPMEEIGGSIVTSTNSSHIVSKNENRRPGYGFCEIPTARKIINSADVPGRTLVRGQDVRPPLESYRKFPFFNHIEKAWEKFGLQEGNELQKAVWPNFAHKHDIFVVGGSKNGKSLSYMIPMCADIIANASHLNQDIVMGHGPFGMILCSTASSGIKLEGHGIKLLTSTNLNQMNCVFTNENNKDSISKLRKGSELLITTVDMVISSQKSFVPHFMFDRLRYLVIDDAHIILKENNHKAMKVLKEFMDHVKSNPTAQLIICGNEWTQEIEQLYWKLPERPTVHIGSPYGAIIYSGVELEVHYVPHNTGMIKISEILRKEKDHKKSVIVCCSLESASHVHLELQNKYHVCAHLAVDISPENLNSITMLWNNASEEEPQVLVCTDEVLKFMKITDATNLIHYEMQDSKDRLQKNGLTVFALRFASMWSHMRDITAEPEAVSWDKRGSFGKKLVSHVLMTGKEPELEKIIKTFKKNGFKIPLPLDEHANHMYASKMAKVSICMGTKIFGWCNNTSLVGCKKRHYFIKNDIEKATTLPRYGQVEVRVIDCINPSVYICEIIRYLEMTGQKSIVSYSRKFEEYKKLLDDHYQNRDNRVPPNSFKVGTLCGVVLPDDEGLVRGQIMEVMTRTTTNFPASIRMYCIDTGEKVIRDANEYIYKLPPQLADLPPLCVEMILNGIKPTNCSKEYTDRQIRYARELTDSKIFLAKIYCSIENTIWVNPLVDTKQENGKAVFNFSVRKNITQEKMGQVNDKHENIIRELCAAAEYPMELIPINQKSPIEESFSTALFQKGDQYQWAHLPVSSIAEPDEHSISIVFVKNPWVIYGNILKYEELLDQLIKEMNGNTNALIETTYPEYYKIFSTIYEVGLVVLVLFPTDETWHRAIITDKRIDDGEAYYDVFFIDFGDTLTYVTTGSMFPIQREFVQRLPFQAIAFNASHITPKENCDDDSSSYAPWSEASVDFLFDICIPDEMSAIASVVALSKDPSSESSSMLCKYYCALLFIQSSKTCNFGDEVGEVLVQKGFAEFTRIGEKNLATVKTVLLEKYNGIFDNNQALDLDQSEDDDSDPENKCLAISSAPIDGGQAFPAGYFDDEGFDVYIGNAEQTMSQLGLGLKTPPPLASSTSNSDGTPVSPKEGESEKPVKVEKSQPALSKVFNSTEEPGLKHPKTYWSQTEDQVQLMVELPDISEYTFKIGDNRRTISFRTVKPPNYGFDVESFGTLEEPEVFLTGQYLRVKMKKRLVGHEWKGFNKNYKDVKLPWLKEKLTLDCDEYDDSDEDAPKRDSIPVDYDKMFPDSQSESDDDDGAFDDFDDDDFEKADCAGLKYPAPRPM